MSGKAAVPAFLPERLFLLFAVLLFVLPLSAQAGGGAQGDALYAEHCASCHGADRLGGTGPALLPETIGRLTGDKLEAVIAQGRTATQMPAFKGALGEPDIAALAALIETPLPEPPVWGLAEMTASRRVLAPPRSLDGPAFEADPLNLFVVVESGDHHVTILDGDRFEPIHRFPSHFALHGGPKFSPEGRFVYFASRDGWITRYDLWALEETAEIRVGINTRNLAISGDGRTLAVANYLPMTLVLLDAESLTPLKIIAAEGGRDHVPSRVSAVYQAAPRDSFVVALKDVPEIWEISWLDDPEPVYEGLVHSYEEGMVEALAAQTGRFPVQRIETSAPLDDFFFDPGYRRLIGANRAAGTGVVVHLDVRREIAEIDLPGMPHLGSGITWMWQGRRVMATPHLGEGVISVIDMENWEVIKRIETAGPGFFLRSHENTPYVWADVFFGPASDVVHLIDKQSLEIALTLTPEPGKTAAHVEFTRDGGHALLSIWEMDGAVIVYDAATGHEIKRLPMVKPSGKYNVFNKITLSEGTSH